MGKYLALYFVIAFHCLPSMLQPERAKEESSLSQIFTCMDKVANYYELNYERMNLDGILGARLAAGQLKGFLVSVGKTDAEDSRWMEELNKIRILQDRFQKIADDGINYVEAAEPAYYKNIGFLLYDGHWEMFYHWRKTDPSLAIPLSRKGEQINGTIIDYCNRELIRQSCVISKYCWKKMTSPGYSGYSLTHEILYFMIANDYGCKKEAETLAKDTYNKTIDELQGAFCSNVLKQSEMIAEENFPMKWRDIFVEQSNNGRTKREDWELEDGCSTHFTAVTAAALAQYIKYLVSVIYIN